MRHYYRPLVHTDQARPDAAINLAGGWAWFTHVERLSRDAPAHVVPAHEMPEAWRQALSEPRVPIAGMMFDRPHLMGILNVTPDSFSDGGQHNSAVDAVAKAAEMARDGATLLDVGGESTRPGADYIESAEEIRRTQPVIAALRDTNNNPPISIDTRKAAVAEAALDAGADLVNDVSGFTHDKRLAPLCAARRVPVCVMHAQGDPATMQANPRYDNVLLDVFDFLEDRITALVAAGIPKSHIIADPGIGFGKTLHHNLQLLQRLSLFHGLGVPVLLGASRKKFIGTISKETRAEARMPGSVAVALAAIAQGIQIVRVHDVAETHAALALWQATREGAFE